MFGGHDKDEAVSDRAYDEAIPVETDDEEVSTPASSEAATPQGASASRMQPQAYGSRSSPPNAMDKHRAHSDDEDEDEEGSESGSSSSEATSTSESSGDGTSKPLPANAYNPDEFKGMKVSSEVEELFQYITRYKPHTIELDTTLKPFIPELIPSIGEVDAFIKMPQIGRASCRERV